MRRALTFLAFLRDLAEEGFERDLKNMIGIKLDYGKSPCIPRLSGGPC
jgi:hypothetical protein